MTSSEEMLEFQKGIAYAFLPHNFHPLSPLSAGYDVYKDPTDPFAWGYMTGSALTMAPHWFY